MSSFLVVTPSHRVDPKLAIAAARAGEVGVVDLGYEDDHRARLDAIREVKRHAGTRGRWGARWDTWGEARRGTESLGQLADRPWPLLVLAGLAECCESLSHELKGARRSADKVFLEVYTLAGAHAAEEAGFDGVIVKGHEGAARVAPESTFILLQRLHGRLKIPYFVQGGMAPDTAAAAMLAGASGIVLCEQVWLAAESPLSPVEQRMWAALDGSETALVGDAEVSYRLFSRADRSLFDEFERAAAEGEDWQAQLRARMVSDADRVRSDDFREVLLPLSPDIAFAKRLSEEHVTVAGILDAFKHRVEENLRQASTDRALAAGGPLAVELRTEFPILQGPMTRVSDVAPFCQSVADNGGLPFLALALMRGDEVREILTRTKSLLAQKPWGVGILGFVPSELRNKQLAVVNDVRPPFAIVAGGRPAQARQLEEQGISTFLHTPSPGLLENLLRDGCRKFIFEGRECGGHVGPRNSFVLWQSAIDVLLSAKLSDPEELQLIFAGGVHDGLSAAMVAALAAPLTARGMKIGVLMGTAYLFTREAVACGAILPGFQEQAIACHETVLLKSGVGHETRCSATPFADEFNATRHMLLRGGKSAEEVRLELERLNLGRLRIAAKGLARQGSVAGSNQKGEIYSTRANEQLQNGMYMIGQVAALRNATIPMRDLHLEVAQNGSERLRELAKRRLPWQQKRRAIRSSRAKRANETSDVAIIGVAGVFPRAPNARAFWENIFQKRDAFEEVPPERWSIPELFTPGGRQRDQVYSKLGAFLGEMAFNPMQWLIPPASLPSIDPTQLMALEVAWQALVDAGYQRRKFARNRMGVIFASAGASEMELQYAIRTMMREYLPQLGAIPKETSKRVLEQLEGLLPSWTEDSFPGFLHNVIAGRITNRLNLGGPNFVVDAACAGSLAAIHTAVEHLRAGASDTMIVGAADVTNHPVSYMSFAQTHALSPTGPPRPFDRGADGIALGECVAAVVLKRLSDAERDGDKIYAVIKGIGASSDGQARSMTSPDPRGQIAALEAAYKDAGILPESVSLIEAHATGTPVGDRAEVASLKSFFVSREGNARQIAVGSIKSMIGHTKTAAGLASLVKAALAIDQRVLPPTIGVERPHAELVAEDCPLYVNSETRPWFGPADGQPRRAGINSFGFGGTNFHAILEEYCGDFHQRYDVDLAPRPAEVVLWTGASRREIRQAIEQLQARLADSAIDDVAQVCCSLSLKSARSQRSQTCRLSLVARSVDDLKAKLQTSLEQLEQDSPAFEDGCGVYYSEDAPLTASDVCFLYPGQGSQAVNMLRDLVVSSQWTHDLLTRLDGDFQKKFAKRLTQFLYPPPAFTADEERTQRRELNDPRVAQPVLGTVEVFATRLLERFGIVPGRTAGHSYGEYVALWAAGCLSLDDLLQISMERGEVLVETKFNEHLRSIDFHKPALPVSSNTTGGLFPESADEIRSLLARHLVEPVQFETQIRQLRSDGVRLFLEVGPGTVLTNLVRSIIDTEADCTQVALDEPGTPGWLQLGHVVARAAALGLRVKVEAWYERRGLKDVPLTELLEDVARQSLPKAADWILTPSRVIPRSKAAAKPPDAVASQPKELNGSTGNAQTAEAPVRRAIDFFAKPAGCLEDGPISGNARSREVTTVSPPAKIAPPERPQREPLPAATISQPSRQASALSTYVIHSKVDTLMDQSQLIVNQHTELSPSAPTEWLPVLQNTMTRWMELQTSQNRVMERFLNLQELLAFGLAPRSATNPAQPQPRAVAAPIEQPPATYEQLHPTNGSRKPIAIPRAPAPPRTPQVVVSELPRQTSAPLPTAVPASPARPVSAVPVRRPIVQAEQAPTPAAASKPAPLAIHPQTVAAKDKAPSTDDFRRDLLQAVSDRTGYPVDVLDETVPLEAGLGIDSIKTVEIFSNLKEYHQYFQAEDAGEEDLLEQFSKLKTLRDIVRFYEQRRAELTAAPS